ncbi:GNAT superfamily N-acetyltransferase [Peribacillus deserti]|uniref:GNAT superfamily N-acetyltransferase n=2 Tax=Peribacillus deserti TaxID=673318 RepID=A0ABS2QMD5_9BACI|nr:GNAT superfamily N-acetyltransferase [Peribacillus deserti]
MGLQFVKGYRNNETLRNSFNQLSQQIFGINFESWYKAGFWIDKYEPYSYIDDHQVVANVSVNKIDLILHKEHKRGIQIGTVMTHLDYRGQGLSKRLMNKVLEDFADYDFIYLFANQSVLNFYPKFGFMPMKEVQYFLDFENDPAVSAPFRKLDVRHPADLSFIFEFASIRIPISRKFGTVNVQELLMFYCMYVFRDDIYFFEEDRVLVIAQNEGHTLHVFDIISVEELDIKKIIYSLTLPASNRIVFHFTPDYAGIRFKKELLEDTNVLFVRSNNQSVWPKDVKHPITSQA